MKKILLACCMLFAGVVIFAQKTGTFTPETSANNKGYDEKTTRIIIPENQHTTDDTAEVRLVFWGGFVVVGLLLWWLFVTYDKGQAMNTVLACLEDFMKANQYYHYKYLARDKEKYFKNERGYSCAQYMSYVKFTR